MAKFVHDLDIENLNVKKEKLKKVYDYYILDSEKDLNFIRGTKLPWYKKKVDECIEACENFNNNKRVKTDYIIGHGWEKYDEENARLTWCMNQRNVDLKEIQDNIQMKEVNLTHLRQKRDNVDKLNEAEVDEQLDELIMPEEEDVEEENDQWFGRENDHKKVVIFRQ